MKLVSFRTEDAPQNAPAQPGIADGARVIGLSSLGYPDTLSFISAGAAALAQAQSLVVSSESWPLTQVRLAAPLANPPRIFAIGLNYQEHAAESKMSVQKVPTVFFKIPSAIVGPEANIVLPAASSQPDYEAELAVVIGKPGYRIPAAQWEDHVFGYTILNDVSARDVQLATSQWTLGKSFPTFSPLGPWIVTRDEIRDPHTLDIRLQIDGETLQDSNTSLLIFRVPALIEYISGIVPLEAGDIISTGTPPGVGLGRTPPRWLKPGEEVVITISSIGSLRNRTVAG
jgi:2-keto-4-pentenoate hydratase/2-oxohepta-3-ene-1,7-dioic acid hydratase in catechol pathway